MEESKKPKNITNCDNSKKDNSNVINHLDDDNSVTKKVTDNETKTVSVDKASQEDTKDVSKDGNNAGEWLAVDTETGDIMINTDSDTAPGFGFLKLSPGTGNVY